MKVIERYGDEDGDDGWPGARKDSDTCDDRKAEGKRKAAERWRSRGDNARRHG